MNKAKEIAEKIIKNEQLFASIGANVNSDQLILARAYLELEEKNDKLKNYEIAGYKEMRNEMKSEITKLKEENEKLKKSREVLRASLKFYSAHELKFAKYGMPIGESLVKEFYSNGSNARQAIIMDDGIMKGK